MLRRTLFILIPFAILTCSPDRPAPAAPVSAGKTADDGLGGLFDTLNDRMGDVVINTTTVKPDSLEVADSLRFHIELRFHDSVPQEHWELYRRGADRWEEIITHDLPDATIPYESTGVNMYYAPYSPGLLVAGEPVDDLIVTVTHDDAIWGVGIGGPTWLRPESRLPIAGFIVADVEYMAEFFLEIGQLRASYNQVTSAEEYAEAYLRHWIYETAIHEIGHVLGIGTTWTLDHRFHLNEDPMKSYYAGKNSLDAFSVMIGTPFTGTPVPVYDVGHWNGRIVPGAMMSNGSLHGTGRISTLTVGALADLGYEVDWSQGRVWELFDSQAEFGTNRLSALGWSLELEVFEQFPDLKRIDHVRYVAVVESCIRHGTIEDGYDGIWIGLGRWVDDGVWLSGGAGKPTTFPLSLRRWHDKTVDMRHIVKP